MTSQETVGALIAKDIWLQYKTPDGFVDVQALLDNIANELMTFQNDDPDISITTNFCWTTRSSDTGGKCLWVNDPDDGWTKL